MLAGRCFWQAGTMIVAAPRSLCQPQKEASYRIAGMACVRHHLARH